MCIIVVKKEGLKMPSNNKFKTCFNANNDGAGYMFAVNNKVHIVKGLMSYNAFKKSLDNTRSKYGDDIAYVFHFRISTQGGVNKELCHPYPLTDDMEALKKLNTLTNIGVAHNGIISLTSTWNKCDYNDTMLFITDYLSELVKNRNDLIRYRTLIERLTSGSRLAILFDDGKVELTGSGWIEEDGIFYSNTSYQTYNYKKTYKSCKYNSSYDDYDDYKDLYCSDWDWYFDTKTNEFLFDDEYCPLSMEDDGRYCDMCANRKNCELYKWLKENN